MNELLPDLKAVLFFSEGCDGQYKNYILLCQFQNELGISAEYNFFATSHGKSLYVMVLEVR